MTERDADQGERLRQISQRLHEFGIAHQMDDEIDDLIEELSLPSRMRHASARVSVSFDVHAALPSGMSTEEAFALTVTQASTGSVLIEWDAPEVEIALDGGSIITGSSLR